MTDYFEISEPFLKINELAKKGDHLIESQNFHKAICFILNALEINKESPSLYLKLAECYFKINLHFKSLEFLKTGLGYIDDSSSTTNIFLKIQFYLLFLQLGLKFDSNSYIESSIRHLEDLIKFEKFENEKLSQIKDAIEKGKERINMRVNDNSKITNRKEEGLKVVSMIQEEQDRPALMQEGIPFNIIPMSWFDQWRRYVFLDKDENSSKRKQYDELLGDDHPGLICQNELLSNEKICLDPNPVKFYTNSALKDGLLENTDFLILPHKVWKFLHKIYGGDEIKRYRICLNDESEETFIELFLKKNRVIIFPKPDKNEKEDFLVFQLSKKERVIDLKKKILRNLETKYEKSESLNSERVRLWKLNSECSYTELQNKFLKDDRVLKNDLLNDDYPLEDCDIADEDFLLLDVGDGKNPSFITKEEFEESKLTRCGHCGTQEKRLIFCECKKIKYCGENCQKQDRLNHKTICEQTRKENSHVNEKIKIFGITPPVKLNQSTKNGLTGLQNLGNTCFMNSSIQCLSHVQDLTQFFLANEHVTHINRDNKLGSGGYLASTFGELLKILWGGNEKYFSPWKLKKVIEKFAPQFSGYQQHDSQELLSYVLDGLHEDLNRIKQKPYIENIESTGKEKDEEVAGKSWDIYSKRNQSKITDIFTGQYKSTLKCPKCHKISITFDPFLSVSLPIPGDSDLKNFYLYFIPADSKDQPSKISMKLPDEYTIKEIRTILSKELNTGESNLKFFLIKQNVVQEELKNDATVEQIDETSALLFVFELNEPSGKIFTLQIKDESNNKKTFDRYICIPKKYSVISENVLLAFVHRYLRPFLQRVIDLKDEVTDLEKEIEEIYTTKKLMVVSQGNNTLSYIDEQIDQSNLIINVLVTPSLDINTMKFNKCTEHKLSYKHKLSDSFDIMKCFSLFTKEEILEEGNEWYCSSCKSHMKASKKMELYKLPDTLILHLKRFKAGRSSKYGNYALFLSGHTQKLDSLIDFPLNYLNLTNYEVSSKGNEVIYDCFAVSNHYGGIGGGHYTAFCKNFLNDQWYEFNDSQVLKISETDVVSSSAYVLFYKKRKKL